MKINMGRTAFQFKLIRNRHFSNGTRIQDLRAAGFPEATNLEDAKEEVANYFREPLKEIAKENSKKGYEWKSEWTSEFDNLRKANVHILSTINKEYEIHLLGDK